MNTFLCEVIFDQEEGEEEGSSTERRDHRFDRKRRENRGKYTLSTQYIGYIDQPIALRILLLFLKKRTNTK